MPPKKRVSQGKQAYVQGKSVACRVLLVQKDITSLHEDAIVNAANDKLERGGGVCGSIFRAAGPYLDAACAALNGCATGDAVLTESFNIQHVKAIVHAVGPRVVGSLNDRHRRDLASCYARSLDVAVQHGLNSIAFPCISTALFGFPNEEAARVALDAVKLWLHRDNNATKLSQIVFCTYLDVDRGIYKSLLPGFFPGYVDETNTAVVRGRGRPLKGNAESSDTAVQNDHTLQAAGDVHSEAPAMPAQTDTQLSAKRKRGRPSKTPTQGPAAKQMKEAILAPADADVPMDSSSARVTTVPLENVYKSYAEVLNKEEWLSDKAPLFHEREIAKLCDDPQDVKLEPAHIDTFLQHVVLFHKRQVLLLSSLHSADFADNMRKLGDHRALPSAEWKQHVRAAVPLLADDRLLGNIDNFDLVIMPIYVPDHYVLGIYDVTADRIHYYDSLPSPDAYRCATTKVFLRATVRQLKVKRGLPPSKSGYMRHADSTYAKQSDDTSCGFFVCYYVEAFLTLRRSSVFFMTEPDFIRDYRRRVLAILLSVSTWTFPEYVPLTGFAQSYSRAQTLESQSRGAFVAAKRSTQAASFGMAAVAQTRESRSMDASSRPLPSTQSPRLRNSQVAMAQTGSTTDTRPSKHPQPSTQSARLAHVTKEVVASLVTSVQFKPADTAAFPGNISPRAMFMYLRTAVSMYQLPVAVASPLLAQQKVFGKNAVRDVGFKLHKPPVETLYVLIPFPLREGDGASVDVDKLSDLRW
ncbi:O-acetyl-ADP-ribose deacetylase MACROD2, partial [Aphelenchoides avenae]